MFSLCSLVFFIFLFLGKIGKKLHTNRSNAVIGGVMLNVVMWVHVSLNVNHFVGFRSFTHPFRLLGLDTLTLGLQHFNARSSLDLVMGK